MKKSTTIAIILLVTTAGCHDSKGSGVSPNYMCDVTGTISHWSSSSALLGSSDEYATVQLESLDDPANAHFTYYDYSIADDLGFALIDRVTLNSSIPGVEWAPGDPAWVADGSGTGIVLDTSPSDERVLVGVETHLSDGSTVRYEFQGPCYPSPN